MMLTVECVSKKYQSNQVLKNISFEVKKGEVVSIIGKSGCGKSTLLKCINRLETIDEGLIKFEGQDISKVDIKELRQKIGIVFQEYNLFEHLTVLENLTIGLVEIKKQNPIYAKQEAIKILEKVGLQDKVNNYPDELSGGQKQRVAIARTLLMKPKLILLDEPTSALDKEMKEEVIKLILQMANDDMTLLIVSHEESMIKTISDKIIEIKNGKVIININKEKRVINGK